MLIFPFLFPVLFRCAPNHNRKLQPKFKTCILEMSAPCVSVKKQLVTLLCDIISNKPEKDDEDETSSAGTVDRAAGLIYFMISK